MGYKYTQREPNASPDNMNKITWNSCEEYALFTLYTHENYKKFRHHVTNKNHWCYYKKVESKINKGRIEGNINRLIQWS